MIMATLGSARCRRLWGLTFFKHFVEVTMALLKEEKEQILAHFKTSELDTGSSEVQVALLSFRIKQLTEHFKKNKVDHNYRRGLVRMVNRRRKILKKIKRKEHGKYASLIKELGIRK